MILAEAVGADRSLMTGAAAEAAESAVVLVSCRLPAPGRELLDAGQARPLEAAPTGGAHSQRATARGQSELAAFNDAHPQVEHRAALGWDQNVVAGPVAQRLQKAGVSR